MTPKTMYVFFNGLAAVFDADGKQMPEYQQGDCGDAMRLLTEHGYHLKPKGCAEFNILKSVKDDDQCTNSP